ncbi:Beta-lactamase hydrolase-like protein [Thalassovita autumnalis]|uniref:Beta-lactamase hydrolase-like protein n=1 Tax=Thalassovita autumnalis TaxID=2072972 RepID=A0A0P1FWE3_9RHOB|nr:TIGR01244 family sulfur transferase [Thalassovita autumnalis]CUH69696.1 Beta-lactamase hydrolase-like protein [Thalassovita autumnalis]CUH73099.1 Beta-lactamase hydrolase-like protein [Thalassovita autumnalis]
MDIRQITPRYSVSPQINPEDFAAIKAAGFTKVICNRPDVENPPSHQADAMAAAAAAAGIQFEVLELTHQTMTPDNVVKQFEMVDAADGPVLAYCASGTRCTVIWALSQAGKASADEILGTAAQAGYMLEQLRPHLEG